MRLEDVREGDIATVMYRKSETSEWAGPYTGPLVRDNTGQLCVMEWPLVSGRFVKFVSAERPKPQLPTEIGSQVMVYRHVGASPVEGELWTLSDRTTYPWTSPEQGVYAAHEILEWAPVEITVGERVIV